mgnify:FL=1
MNKCNAVIDNNESVLSLALFILFLVVVTVGLGVVKNVNFGTDDVVEVNANEGDVVVSSCDSRPPAVLGSIGLASLSLVSLSSASDLA